MFDWMRRRRERELDEEIEAHLRMTIRDRVERGESPEEAARAARREFGCEALVKETTRDMWGLAWVGRAAQDLRYAARTMRRSPGFTAVALLSLALGIGANTAIFSMLDAILWKPLPVADAASLVRIRTIEAATGRARGVPPALLPGLTRRSEVFSGTLCAIPDGIAFHHGDRTERVIGDVVTANYFSLLGIQPYLGHFFSGGADGAAWQPVAVLSYDFFQRRFGGDSAIVGQTVHLNGYPFTVIGVSPPGFFGLEVGTSYEVRVPMMLDAGMQQRLMPAMHLLDPRRERFVNPIARLRPGVTRQQAEAATEVVYQQLFAADPELSTGRRYAKARVVLEEGSRGKPERAEMSRFARPLLILMAVVGLVLLIACTNIANLLLARAAARQREMAVRLAIGASRARLLLQLLTESLLLAGLGGILGLAFAWWGGEVLVSFLPQGSVPLVLELRPDVRALAFTLALAVFTSILFGLAPAMQVSRPNPIPALKSDGATQDASGVRRRLGEGMIVAQVALALVLVLGAGLFLRSLKNLKSTRLGFPADQLVMFSMKPVLDGNVRYSDTQVYQLFGELVRRVQALPGVTGAAMSADGPMGGWRQTTRFEREDRSTVTLDIAGDMVSPEFFPALGITLVSGRLFTAADRRETPKVAVVSDTLARDLFGGESPLGRKVKTGTHPSEPWREIVGVVRSVRYDNLRKPDTRVYLFPYEQFGGVPTISTLIVRASSANLSSLVAAVRREFQSLDKNLPVFNVRTAATQIDRALSQERLIATLSGIFGGVALILAAIGLYGVIAYAVARRVKEIGIRIALGAGRGDVHRLVLQNTLRLILTGAAIGLPVGLAAARLVASELYGVSPHDPAVAGGGVVLILAVGLAAGWWPARRAARLDPLTALRQE
ncbi:MAG: ABC transporter permease [Bryobacteraceae bacterium]